MRGLYFASIGGFRLILSSDLEISCPCRRLAIASKPPRFSQPYEPACRRLAARPVAFRQAAITRGFAHFPYVNKSAQGGSLRIAAIGSFDNLNQFTIKGNAPVVWGSFMTR